MSTIDPSHDPGKRRPRSACAYLRRSWPGIIAIVAVVTILGDIGILGPIDNSAFFLVGAFLNAWPDRGAHVASPHVVVALIDQGAFETEYRERSPLYRCALRDHLRAIYEASPLPPTLVVVDLDLSPTRLADEDEHERECQKELYRVIGGARGKTKTVLMNPLPMIDNHRARTWQKDMEEAGVQFGQAMLPINLGLAIRHHCVHESLAGVAYLADRPHSLSWLRGSCLGDRRAGIFIDPGLYNTSIVKIDVVSAQVFAKRIAEELNKIPTSTGDQRRVVFFGGDWGQTDRYLTPVGELSGVLVHAGAYLTIGNPLRRVSPLLDVAIHFLIAWISGFVFAACWQRYFAAAFAPSPARREYTILYLGVVGIVVGAFLLVFVGFSWYLLRLRVWLSPIPLIGGMVVHSFSESLTEAAHPVRGDESGSDGQSWHVRLRGYVRQSECWAAFLLSLKLLALITIVVTGLVLVMFD